MRDEKVRMTDVGFYISQKELKIGDRLGMTP